MNIHQRISAFNSLGIYLENSVSKGELNADFVKTCSRAELQNPWFTHVNIVCAIKNIISVLQSHSLEDWISQSLLFEKQKRVALILQGKIPLDGFGDIFAILLSGNKLVLKLAEKDKILTQYVLEKLIEIEPEFQNEIIISTRFLPKFDAIITDNTNPQFAKYFSQIPHVIRNPKTSVAVLTGNETAEDLQKLGNDIFQYFGQSEQNVTKVYMPIAFDETRVLDALEQFNFVSMHYKYMNNYEYNKSIYLVAQQKHLDNGFLIFKEDEHFKSPLAVVYYEKYSDLQFVAQRLENKKDEIQNVITKETSLCAKTKSFGNAFDCSLDDCCSFLELQ